MLRALILALSFCPAVSTAQELQRAGDLTFEHTIVKAVTATALTTAGFFSVTNLGQAPDWLIDVRADFPRVEMHDTMTNAEGIASMARMNEVEIPAGETITFERGGRHIMFMGLGGVALEQNDTVDVILVFERAGEIAVQFRVQDLNQAATH